MYEKIMNWSDILKMAPIYLNLAGEKDCHPKDGYKNYVSVDISSLSKEWTIRHDLREPIPLPDKSVERMLSEHFLEHMEIRYIDIFLRECHRLLKHGEMMRIAVPDYGHPSYRQYLIEGVDPKNPMMCIVKRSQFTKYKFYHYWDNGKFVYNKIDYSLGTIKRTPDNDRRCHKHGHRLDATSIVVDLFKY